jgi:predicted AAA+ superfamily ATPase
MIDRYLQIAKFIDRKQSIFLFGPRGAGKTKLIEMVLPINGIFIQLLESEYFHRYLSNPALFSQEIKTRMVELPSKAALLVAVDEIQKLPSLLDEIHSLIEIFKGRLSFVLTGSSLRKLKRSGANLLAARALTTYLHPLSILETELKLDQVLKIGSLPGVYLDPEFAKHRLRSYIGTYLQEEIQEESLVRKIDRFSRFLDLAGQLNGEPINFSKLGRTLKTTSNTVQEYFSILEDTLLCHRLDGWSESVKKQLLQAPKYYWFDCGVLNALNGELDTELKPSSYRYGRLFETYLVQEMIRHNDYLERGFRFFYWRDKNGAEVDLIVTRSSSKPLAAIEFKSSSAPNEEDCKGLLIFREDYPKVPCYCFSKSPKCLYPSLWDPSFALEKRAVFNERT